MTRRPRRPKYDSRVFFALVLAVESCALFLFLATDVFLFYVFFEVILIPMYFLIGGFGGARRSYAAAKFLIFGLLGGFVMLASVIGLYVLSAQAGRASYLLSDLMQLDIATGTGRWLFLGFMFAFAIKAPLVPLHTWLPDAAEESSPGGATMMVGVMDKIGTFGMIRFCLGLFPEASQWATPVVLVLAVISILYGAILAIGSRDLMRLIAYTSISHFGFIVLGIFAFTSQSMVGSTLYMLNHGLSTAGLFLVVGYLIKRRGSRDVYAFGGVQKVAPVAAALFLFAGLSTLSLPGLSSFVSEFMVLAGTFSRHPAYAAVSTLAIVLAALYILLMYQRTMTGPVTADVERTITDDLNGRERLALAPLVILILVLGVFPKPMLDCRDAVHRAGSLDQAARGELRPGPGRHRGDPGAAGHHRDPAGDHRQLERLRRRRRACLGGVGGCERAAAEVRRPGLLRPGAGGRERLAVPVPGHRRVPVLRLLRGHPDPDVLPDRWLRRHGGLRGDQVPDLRSARRLRDAGPLIGL